MLFSSYVFVACFLPAAVCGFFALARLGGRPAAALWLIAASFFFYGWWNPAFVKLLAISIAFNYGLARLIGDPARAPRIRSALLGFGIAADLGALVYFKYLAALLGVLHLHFLTDPVLPLGISFFTFTQIGFLIDTRYDAVAEKGLLNYLLFVTFFPHLIAGPLLHHREMMPQFAAPATYRACAENIAVGLAIFSIGLVKKALFADRLSRIAIAGFAIPTSWRWPAPGRRRWPIRWNSTTIFPAIRTWRSGSRGCSTSAFRPTSTPPTRRRASSNTGSAGT